MIYILAIIISAISIYFYFRYSSFKNKAIGLKRLKLTSNNTNETISDNKLTDKEIELSKYIPKIEAESNEKIVTSEWKRLPNLAKYVVNKANYKCAIDREHQSFYWGDFKNNYVEAHHLIPLKHQEQFKQNLDIAENIVALCPNCHSAIHYAKKEHQIKLLKSLWEKQHQKLASKDLLISFDDLMRLYDE